ncbi:element excision factor XisH family protein [Leptolyngbya sp. FACHB-17]|uniref:element excision factor XisH family protein n=1 Tax=unclassified Leptolyngbya TaxID=2650499 RepID=UPI00168088D5|nr:element excision factor XisH family protein [Leptolyngbya sp. FACHB-17]MBD2083288.1 hypothetical protein [Leptolyngbya sp. FACHB-17]
MFAKDRFHGIVKTALQKESWTITQEPYTLPIPGLTSLFFDLGAEKLIIAEQDRRKIAVVVSKAKPCATCF